MTELEKYDYEKEYKESLRSHLKSRDWQGFCTVTFRKPVSLSVVKKKINSLLWRIRLWDRAWDLAAFVVCESSGLNETFHVHFLIGSKKKIRLGVYENFCKKRIGLSEFEEFNRNEKGIDYITKLVKPDTDIGQLRWYFWGKD